MVSLLQGLNVGVVLVQSLCDHTHHTLHRVRVVRSNRNQTQMPPWHDRQVNTQTVCGHAHARAGLHTVQYRRRPANCTSLSYLSRSLVDRWGTTVDFTTSFLHSSRFSAFRSMHGIPFQASPLFDVRPLPC